jgi:DNA repair protein RecN (Recombination protein N)
MLTSIEIQNYALIQHVKIDLQKGLTAITGETGSGKSIIMGALGLLLGERADTKSITKPDLKCVVEAQFEVHTSQIGDFFERHDLDHDTTVHVRREITPTGKSRAFINDTPVNLQTLQDFGELVIDIHSQHQNKILSERSFRYSLLDAFHPNAALFDDYAKVFQRRQEMQKQLEELRTELAALHQEQDYRLFQLHEIEQLQLEDLDQIALESERDELANADTILQGLHLTTQIMDDEQGGVLAQMHTMRTQLQKVNNHSNKLQEFEQRLQHLLLELKELSGDLADYSDKIHNDPKRLELVLERLSSLYHLLQKHRMTAAEDLRQYAQNLRDKSSSTQQLEWRIEAMQKEWALCNSEIEQSANRLSTSRKTIADQVASEIQKRLNALGMESAQMHFEIKPSNDYHKFGKDELEWSFTANPGMVPQPIHKVASGGEISRVMLAVKATLSQRHALPILVLDEIDQGVSGEIGKKIGLVLKEMSSQMQLLTITHLAQIAGQAQDHLKVYKKTEGQTTITKVERLDAAARVEELAEMISGKTKSEAALANAKELLN